MKIVRKPGVGAKTLKIALQGLDGKVGKVGWFKGNNYETGTPVAYVAVIQEFGSPSNNIPARSFMRSTMTEKKTAWAKSAENISRNILKGYATAHDAMELLGQQAKGDIQKTIVSIQTPALKNTTIKARMAKMANKKVVGSLTKPLVEKGILLGTIVNTVENK